MFSLSTSWNSSKHKNGYDLVKEIKAMGFDTIELNFALTEDVVADILKMAGSSEIKVSSLHNICPLPAEVEPDEASPDYYSLASPDEKERKLAVDVTKNTVLCAKRLGASAVVLHIGRVQIKDRTKDLAGALGDKARYEELKMDIIKERAEKRDGYLDNAIESLNQLIPYARKTGVALAIENRYYYREIPLIDELEAVFAKFKTGDLFYWHDAGHAQVFENLGLARHRDFLEKFQSRLIGVHLHDIIPPISDHKPPGKGSMDFRIVKPFITKETIKVLEVHQPATAEEIKGGADYLAKILG